VRHELDILENDGIDADRRRQALRKLLQLYLNDEILRNVHMQELGNTIFKTSFRVLIDAPPELIVEMMRFFRNHFPDPHLIRILVHYVWPYTNERTTPQVRVEVIRTIAACCGEAALPSILYSLHDEPGDVLREVDKALMRLTDRRGPVGSDPNPLTQPEKALVRRYWLEWSRTPGGAAALAKSYGALGRVVKKDPAHTRNLASAPLVHHAVELVLFDNDMPWEAWKAAFDFLKEYWGKDYRPPERRDKAVEPFERDGVVKRLREDWNSSLREEQPAPQAPGVGDKEAKPASRSSSDPAVKRGK
jgi:hypothetical protein